MLGIGVWVMLAGLGPVGPDLAWHDVLRDATPAWLLAAAKVLNVVGGSVVMSVLSLVLAVGLFLAKRRTAALAVTMTMIGAVLASEFLKSVVQRPRPIDALVAAGGDSFPSGHSTAAAALAVCLALLIRRAWVWVLAVAWVVAMMLSRQMLLVHWLSDTVAGALLGTAVAILATRFALNRARARHDHPEHPAHG